MTTITNNMKINDVINNIITGTVYTATIMRGEWSFGQHQQACGETHYMASLYETKTGPVDYIFDDISKFKKFLRFILKNLK